MTAPNHIFVAIIFALFRKIIQFGEIILQTIENGIVLVEGYNLENIVEPNVKLCYIGR